MIQRDELHMKRRVKHYVSTAGEAINFDLEDQGRVHQDVDLGLEEGVRAREEIQNYFNKKKEQEQI